MTFFLKVFNSSFLIAVDGRTNLITNVNFKDEFDKNENSPKLKVNWIVT